MSYEAQCRYSCKVDYTGQAKKRQEKQQNFLNGAFFKQVYDYLLSILIFSV